MATGTGNLPNQNMSFSPFAILTAEEMNDLVENIESLADGSGIGDVAITASNIDLATLYDAGVWWEELARVQGTGSSSILNIPLTTTRTFMKVIWLSSFTGDPTGIDIRFNSDSNNNYAYRMTSFGNSYSSSLSSSQSRIQIAPTGWPNGVLQEIDLTLLGASGARVKTVHNHITGATPSAATFQLTATSGGYYSSTPTSMQLVSRNSNFSSSSVAILIGHD